MEAEQKRKDLYATEIRQQIKTNETNKMLEDEKIAEVRIINTYDAFYI